MKQKVKLSKWAKLHGLTYKGAYNAFLRGNIPNTSRLETGTILVELDDTEKRTVIYSRVSTHGQKNDLKTQATRLTDFCIANGWIIDNIYKEIASGVNDNRPKLNKIMQATGPIRLVVEHKDRLTRFGFNYIQQHIEQNNGEIIVVNAAENSEDDLIHDFVSIITSMVARLYGRRRSKRKTEKLIKDLQND